MFLYQSSSSYLVLQLHKVLHNSQIYAQHEKGWMRVKERKSNNREWVDSVRIFPKRVSPISNCSSHGMLMIVPQSIGQTRMMSALFQLNYEQLLLWRKTESC